MVVCFIFTDYFSLVDNLFVGEKKNKHWFETKIVRKDIAPCLDLQYIYEMVEFSTLLSTVPTDNMFLNFKTQKPMRLKC